MWKRGKENYLSTYRESKDKGNTDSQAFCLEQYIKHVFIFFFLPFFGCTRSMLKLPGRGLNVHHNSDDARPLPTRPLANFLSMSF